MVLEFRSRAWVVTWTVVSSSAQIVRFGVFEADLQTGELRKNGVKVPLAGPAVSGLCHPAGTTRASWSLGKSCAQQVWPEDTFVDFDHALNTAITKIRMHWETMPTIPGLSRLFLAAAIASSARWTSQVQGTFTDCSETAL